MTEKLTYEAIEEMVEKAKAQTARMIDSMFRQVVADFEMANSEGFKLALTIEGERKGRDAVLTLQTKGQSAVDLKRKDQTQAEIVDWGPNLFTATPAEGFPEDGEDAEPAGLIDAPPKLLPPHEEAAPEPEDDDDGDAAPEDDAADEEPNN